MMEPRIQYAKTADGVSIAFWTLGQGMPLVNPPTYPASHLELEWQIPEIRHWEERLAQKRMLVRYDGRGTGLSERDVADYSLEAQMLDLQSVVDRLGLERFALLALFLAGPVAIAYAARHPEQVSHLLLWHSWARTFETRSRQLRGLRRLLDTDWELYTETAAHFALGWSQGEPVRRTAALYRESATQQTMQAIVAAIRDVDVTGLLPQVKSPTLVLHRRSAPYPEVDVAKRLASGILNARLVLFEGDSGVPQLGDTEAVLRAIDEFLGEGEGAKAAGQLPEGMAVILFTDIADSTALTEQLGDSAFRAKARELDTWLRSVIREAGGAPVEGKVLGDGVMAVFTSARQAIECALHCNAAAQDTGLSLHLGIHAGDIIREGNTVYGGAVNIAARIAGASAAGELLVSDTVRSLARTSANVVFEDRGEHELKGVGEPQRLFAVRGEVA
jgi:class 3 adenylate cyclase